MSTTTTTATTTAETVAAKIFRYNPSIDSKPYYKTYQVPWTDFMSVLELLRYIHDQIEPISFDYSCHASSCGMCTVMMNGKPGMACTLQVTRGNVTVEPLAGFRVIKDLIVDKSQVWDRLYGTSPWFQRTKAMTDPTTMNPDDYVKVRVLHECKDCLSCQAACPVLNKNSLFPNAYKGFQQFAGPFIMTKIAARYYDDREDAEFKDQRLQTAVREGLFNCILCGACDEVCPAGNLSLIPGLERWSINHVNTFKDMMAAAKAKGWGP
jgi:succinate dehydrogenase/fumarate reductase iron-sulfur protein